jgi:hypothetical protein
MSDGLKVSPAGFAAWPCLSSPDLRFGRPGKYSVGLRLRGQSAQDVAQIIEREIETARQKYQAGADSRGEQSQLKLAPVPFTTHRDGSLTFHFRVKAEVNRKGRVKKQRPLVIDSTGRNVNPERVLEGSTIRVSYEVAPFSSNLVGIGVKLKLCAVEVVDLKRGAEYFGFRDETDGAFVAGSRR